MSPAQFDQLLRELRGLGDRVSWLERTVYGAAGAVVITAFFISMRIIKLGG